MSMNPPEGLDAPVSARGQQLLTATELEVFESAVINLHRLDSTAGYGGFESRPLCHHIAPINHQIGAASIRKN